MTTTSGVPGYKLTVPLDAERFINLPDDPFEELLRPTIQQLTTDETAVEIFFTAGQIVLMAKATIAFDAIHHPPTALVQMTLEGAVVKEQP